MYLAVTGPLAMFGVVALFTLTTDVHNPVPHECGQGPVTVKMALGGCCSGPQPTPRIERLDGDLYAMVPNLTTVNAVCMPCDPIEERWTDWPECGGQQIPLTETDLGQ